MSYPQPNVKEKHVVNVNQSNPSIKLTIVSFRVNEETKTMLQDYANMLSKEYLLDTNTGRVIIYSNANQPKKNTESAVNRLVRLNFVNRSAQTIRWF